MSRPARLRFLVELALVTGLAALAVMAAAAPARDTQPTVPAIPRITGATPLAEVERHFGRPLAQTVGSGGRGTFLYAGRRHNWTIVLQIRPIPRGLF